MPAFVHGKNTDVKIDDATGTLFDLSPVANNVDMPRPQETAETSHFQPEGGAKTYIVGLNDSTVSISGLFDKDVDGKIQAVIDAMAAGTLDSCTVQYRPAGNGAGKVQYECEVIWTSYDLSNGVGDVVTFSLEGQRTGTTTRTIQS